MGERPDEAGAPRHTMRFRGKSGTRRYTVVSFGVVAALLLIVLFFPCGICFAGPSASIVGSRLQRPVSDPVTSPSAWGAPTDISSTTSLIRLMRRGSTTQPMASFPRHGH